MAIKGGKLSLEQRRKISEAAKRNWKNPKIYANTVKSIRNKWKNDPVWKEKMRAVSVRTATKQWKDKRFRKLVSAARKRYWADPKNRENIQKKFKAIWANPKTREANRERLKKLWQDPIYRKKMTALFSSKEFRARVSASLKANANGPHRESTVEGAVVNWARKNKILAFKLDANHYAGAPDRMFLIPNGKIIFIEFKKPDGTAKPSKLQLYIHKQIKKAGYEICVCCDEQKAISLLETAQRIAKNRRRK